MPRIARPAALRALPMPVSALLRAGDRVTFVSKRVNTEERAIRVRSGVVVARPYTVCVAEDGRARLPGDIMQVRLRTVRRDGVLIACAPCVPVGPESGYAPPAQPGQPSAPTPLPAEPAAPDPELVAHRARMAADAAAYRKAQADLVRVDVERAEAEVAQRRAAFAEQSARIDAAREASEAAYIAKRDAFRATLDPADRARLERHDRTLVAARERAAKPRPRRTLPPGTRTPSEQALLREFEKERNG